MLSIPRIELTALENPVIKGDQATVLCKAAITTTQPPKTTEIRVQLDLRNRGGKWIITNYKTVR